MNKFDMANTIAKQIDERFDFKIDYSNVELDATFTLKTIKGEVFEISVNKIK